MSYLVTSTSSSTSSLFVDQVNANNLNVSGGVVGDFTGNIQGATEFQATAGKALNKGEPVYISGFNEINGTYIVQKADAKDQTKMPCVGLTKETVAVNGNVKVVTSGLLNNLNTNAFSQGDILYVSINAGALTKVKPFKGNYAFLLTQSIGKVMRKHLTQGSVNIIIGEVDVPNLNHKNVFIGNSSNITENRQLALDSNDIFDFSASNLESKTTNANTLGGKSSNEIFEKMRSKFSISGGGKITWVSNVMQWTEKFVVFPIGQSKKYFHINPSSITLSAWNIAYLRPSDDDWKGNNAIDGATTLTLNVQPYTLYETQLNDIVIAIHNGDIYNNQLYLSDGRVIDPNYSVDCNGSKTFKQVGIQTNNPISSLHFNKESTNYFYNAAYYSTPMMSFLDFEHDWGTDVPQNAKSNAYFFSNSSWSSNKDMAGSIAFGGINEQSGVKQNTIYARMGGRRLGNLYGGFVFQTMRNDGSDSGNLQIDMVIQDGKVGINTSSPTDELHVNGNLKVSGTLLKGSGSFDIPHPNPQKKNTHRLRHYFVETPSAGGNIYKYQINCTKGVNTIDLPDYFEFLNKDGFVWVNPYKHFGRGWGDVVYEGKKLKIYVEKSGFYNVMVFADRKDALAIKNFNKYGIEYANNL